MSLFAALLTEIGAKTIVDKLPKLLMDFSASKIGDAVAGGAEEFIKQEFKKEDWRHALFHFLDVTMVAPADGFAQEAEYLQRLIQRMAAWEDGFKPGEENHFSGLLAGHLEFLAKSHESVEAGKKVSLDDLMLSLPPEEMRRICAAFAAISKRLQRAEQAAPKGAFKPLAVLAAMDDDHIAQHAKRVLQYAQEWAVPLVEKLEKTERQSRTALWLLALATLVFTLGFCAVEISGLEFLHLALFAYVVGGALLVWRKASVVTVALAALQPTRPLVEMAAMVGALAIATLVVGSLLPLHLAPVGLKISAFMAFHGIIAVGIWAALKGVKAKFLTPATVGLVLGSVILVTAFWAFNEKYDGALVENGVNPAYDRVTSVAGELFSSSAEASTLERAGREHSVQSVCSTPMEWDKGLITLPARHDCWSGVIVVPSTASAYMPSAAGNCWEMFFPNSAGDTIVAGEAGFVQQCTDPSQERRGVFRVRTLEEVPADIKLEVSYR